jgi:prepilin-type N-terminal cleavage/methylation domain-containing protein
MRTGRGFSFIEMMVVLAVLGILMLTSFPSVQNTLETRALENSARDILTSCQLAKFLSVSTKYPHRLAFSNASGRWLYWIEEENPPGTWTAVSKYGSREIPTKFSATVDLPGALTVDYSVMGYISNFDSLHRTITLGSARLRLQSAPDLRILRFYAGGSIQFEASQTS